MVAYWGVGEIDRDSSRELRCYYCKSRDKWEHSRNFDMELLG